MTIFKYTVVFTALILLVFSCSKKVVPVESPKPPVIEDVVEVEEVEIEVDTIIEVEEEEEVYILCEIQRSSCYGKCPSYSIKLYSDGKAIYYGKANVDKIGYFEAYCDSQNFEAIFTAAEEIGYFAFRSQYPTDGRNLPDLPKTITYLKRGGLEKRIIDSFDAPSSLVQFEKWLDEFFNSLEWKNIED
jgi:uncharacterized protein DUF6438